MPKYNVTSPTGEKFVITAPEGATEEEVLAKAQEYFAAQPEGSAAQKRVDAMPPTVRALAGVGEAGLQAVTGMGASVAGGIAGMADTATYGPASGDAL